MSEDVQVSFGAAVDGALKGISEVTEHLEGVGKITEGLTEVFGAFGEALLAAFAVEKIKEFYEEFSELGARIEDTTHMMGLASVELSKFEFVAGALGESAASADQAMIKLQRNMSEAGKGAGPAYEAFKALGVGIKDSEGHLRSLADIMPEVADIFSRTADGPEKTAIAISLFGRAGAALIPILDEGRDGLEEWNRVAEQTGTVVTKEMAEGMEKSEQGMYTLGKAFEGVGITLYEALKPALDEIVKMLIKLVEGFNNAMKANSGWNTILFATVAVIDTVLLAIDAIVTAFGILWDAASEVIHSINQMFTAMGKAMYDSMHFNFAAAKQDMIDGNAEMSNDFKKTLDGMVGDAMGWKDRMKSLFNNMNFWGANIDTSGADHSKGRAEKDDEYEPETKLGQIGSGQSQMSDFKQQLQLKMAAEQQYFADSTQMELTFWQSKLGAVEKGSKDYNAILIEMYNLNKRAAQTDLAEFLTENKAKQDMAKNNYEVIMQLEQQKLDMIKKDYGAESAQYKAALLEQEKMAHEHQIELARINNEAVNNQRDLQLQQIAADRDYYQQLNSMDLLSDKQLYLNERALAQQENQLQIQKLQQQKQDNSLTLQGQMQLDNQIKLLKQKSVNDLRKIDTQYMAQQTQQWKKLFTSISTAFSTSIKGIIQGTQTLKGAVQNLTQSILLSFLDMIIQMVTQWAWGQAMNIAAHALGIETIQTQDDIMMSTSLASKAMSSISQISMDAAVAYAGAYSALAAIPYIGPMIAPAGAATAYAGTMAAVGMMGLASAAGGMVVDGDQVARIHDREMVLPAHLSDGIQKMINSGNSGGGGGGHTFYVSAIDAAGVSNFLKTYARDITGTVVNHQKDNPSMRSKH